MVENAWDIAILHLPKQPQLMADDGSNIITAAKDLIIQHRNASFGFGSDIEEICQC